MTRASALLRSKIGVLLLSLLAMGAVLASTRSVWLEGSVDGVAGPVTTSALGTDAATGLTAVALVGPAAAVAAMASGKVGRWIAIVAMALTGLAIVGMSVRVLLEPDLILGQVAARASAGTGAFEAVASVSIWPSVAIAAGLLLVVAAIGAAWGAGSWSGLGERYEAGEAAVDEPAAGARGERIDSDWDRVGRGDEPRGDE